MDQHGIPVVIRRTHDRAIYLKEDRRERPKEVFKRLATLAQQRGLLREGSVVCDFGCATGELLSYLARQGPKATYRGYDVLPELIERARAKTPGVEFHVGSVLARELLPAHSIDVAFLVGVHSIFDDFEPCLSNLLRWVRRGGRIYVSGLFNPYPIDVWVTYRLVDDPDQEHREPGWNMFSKASVSRFLEHAVGPDRYRFLPFEMPFDLAPHPQDLVRSWTFQDRQGHRHLTNGLRLLCHMEILEIQR